MQLCPASDAPLLCYGRLLQHKNNRHLLECFILNWGMIFIKDCQIMQRTARKRKARRFICGVVIWKVTDRSVYTKGPAVRYFLKNSQIKNPGYFKPKPSTYNDLDYLKYFDWYRIPGHLVFLTSWPVTDHIATAISKRQRPLSLSLITRWCHICNIHVEWYERNPWHFIRFNSF